MRKDVEETNRASFTSSIPLVGSSLNPFFIPVSLHPPLGTVHPA